MKKLITTTFSALFAIIIFAQAPQGITHQAVIRNAADELVTNTTIGITVSILHESPTGTVLYSETHSKVTNANGLVTFVIGKGNLVSGDFSNIQWAYGPHFIKTIANVPGAKVYTITGITEVFSVPHAFHAGSLTLTSPGGNHFKIMVDDNGNLSTMGTSDDCPPTVTDYDGNIYNTVFIGEQCWMRENLKTTHYANGLAITFIGNDLSAWQTNTGGAYAWNENDISWKHLYGALYNWHAVNNPNGLCPVGWHVPAHGEFAWLADYLGGSTVAGGKMKSTQTQPEPHPRWDSPNTGASNSSQWSGFPGGYRTSTGVFLNFGAFGYWWTSTPHEEVYAWWHYLSTFDNQIGHEYVIRQNGASVRCIKNQ